ncbi:MAG: CBS domain-containing protein [Aquificaceae bacterium]|nr:CBS domain-containing protein [Aquificaceae bacterium]MDW8097307.1 CBS domain-containing protein [Aquificaceae bacterium]
MRDIELSQLATGVPKIHFDLSVREALRSFEEYGLYEFLVVERNRKPVGIVNRLDLVKAQHKESLTVGDLARPLMKLRTCSVKDEELIYLLDFFNAERTPLLLVDRKGAYVGVLFYQVILHHISLLKETVVPIFQRLRALLGREHYFYCFYMGDLKGLEASTRQSLQRILYEGVKNGVPGDVGMSYQEGEVYVLSKSRVDEEEIKELYREFHREYTLLFGEARPVYLYGYCFSLKEVQNFEEFFSLSSELKKRMKGVQEVSFFIFHGEKTSVVLCEYERRELIHQIKLKIKRDFEKIVEGLKRMDRDLWEVTLYDLFKAYPYFELLYIIGESGLQVSNNVVNPKLAYPVKAGKKGADRSGKEYFKKASHEDVFISNIYISQATEDFCITVSKRFTYGSKTYVLAGDINYREIHTLVKAYAETGEADR